MQHVDALHDDKGLQHVHLELQRLHAEVVEVGEGGREELPQNVSFLGGSFLQPALGKVKLQSQNQDHLHCFYISKYTFFKYTFSSLAGVLAGGVYTI